MEKITKRSFYEALISYATTGDMTLDSADIKTFAENEIALLDKKAAKAKEKAAEKKAEADVLAEAVLAVLTDEPQVIAEILTQVEGEDVTAGKVTNRLSTLVKNGLAAKAQVTVETEDGKKRKAMAYTKA